MEIKTIGTGSSGNAYALIENERILLLDCGVSFKTIMTALNHRILNIDVVLMSHAHADHSKSAKTFANQYIDIVMSKESAQSLSLLHMPNVSTDTSRQLQFGDWIVKCFALEHDSDNIGFLIYHTKTKQRICYITDTGFIRTLPIGVNILICEINYMNELIRTEEMQDRFLRVKSSHMSLERFTSWFKKIERISLTHIIAVHLSDTNSNEREIVRTLKEISGVQCYAAREGQTINLNEIPFL